jgi:hypothetical protein
MGMHRHGLLALALAVPLLASSEARACRVLEVELTPTDNLQIAIWLESADGVFVDTLFITDATGRRGIGNRPGILEFNSTFRWPYGRRESVLPVWAHRRGHTYPRIVFQDRLDSDLSHAFSKSSGERYFCRPLLTDEAAAAEKVVIDTGSCASPTEGPWTDKGMFDRATRAGDPDAGVSYYPPRSDLKYAAGTDHTDVQMYAMLNDLDAISRATPPGRAPFKATFTVPPDVPDGVYAIWVEVGKELDPNVDYRYPSPTLPIYGEYGEAYRGQPSILWKVPIVVDGGTAHAASALDYAGYGDPNGIDGRLREPDNTITTTTEGSGAQRLLIASAAEGMYRVRVTTQTSPDSVAPDPPGEMAAEIMSPTEARVTFVEPADPATGGPVNGYDVRLSVGEALTVDNFATTGKLLDARVAPVAPGNLQSIDVSGLTPQSHYWIGIRAHDMCLIGSTPTIVELVTPRAEGGEVSTCFIATAAFGSPMAAEVTLLRRFRDQVLRRQLVGEMLVESYYTFGPALAGVIRPSDTLRALVRAALEPVVARARKLIE